MSGTFPQTIASSFLLAMSLAAAAGCGGETMDDNAPPSCEEDTRDEAYVAGITKTGSAGYTVTITDSLPAPPAKGNNRWIVEVKDSEGAGQAGLNLVTNPFMPDHGHPSPVLPVVTDQGGGLYQLDPVNLFMPGYWETTITIVDPGSTDADDDDVDLDSVVFKFCIEG